MLRPTRTGAPVRILDVGMARACGNPFYIDRAIMDRNGADLTPM